MSATKGLIRVYIEGRYKILIKNICYNNKKSRKRLCINENESDSELENYVNLIQDIYIGSHISIVKEESHYYSIFICLSNWVDIILSIRKNNVSLDTTIIVGKHGRACFDAILSDSVNH